MGYAKERKKLEQLLTKIDGIQMYTEKNLHALEEGHEKYSHTVRILKNKAPDAFTEHYTTDLQEVKEGRKALKASENEERRALSFDAYKATLKQMITKAIETTLAVG